MHGGQGKIIYLDTEGNFRPERIEAIAERFGLDVEQTLDNIIICRIFSHEEQMEVLKPIAALLSDPDQGPFRLLIVDSIIGKLPTMKQMICNIVTIQLILSTYIILDIPLLSSL